MSKSLNEVAVNSQFGKPTPRPDYDCITRLGGNKAANVYVYADLDITENYKAEVSRHRTGDIIFSVQNDTMQIYRINDDREFIRVKIS